MIGGTGQQAGAARPASAAFARMADAYARLQQHRQDRLAHRHQQLAARLGQLHGKRPVVGLLAAAFEKRTAEHTSELQSLIRITYAVFRLKKKTQKQDSST